MAETDYLQRSKLHRPRGKAPDSYDVVLINTSGRPQLDAAFGYYSGQSCKARGEKVVSAIACTEHHCYEGNGALSSAKLLS